MIICESNITSDIFMEAAFNVMSLCVTTVNISYFKAIFSIFALPFETKVKRSVMLHLAGLER